MSRTDRLLSEIASGPSGLNSQPREPLLSQRVTSQPAASIVTPYLDAAEDAVLSGCACDLDYARKAASKLQPNDFDLDWRRQVFEAMTARLGAGLGWTAPEQYEAIGWPLYDRLLTAIGMGVNPYSFDYIGLVHHAGLERRAVRQMARRWQQAEALPWERD